MDTKFASVCRMAQCVRASIDQLESIECLCWPSLSFEFFFRRFAWIISRQAGMGEGSSFFSFSWDGMLKRILMAAGQSEEIGRNPEIEPGGLAEFLATEALS